MSNTENDQTQYGSGMQNGSETQYGSGMQNGSETQYGSGMQYGSETQYGDQMQNAGNQQFQGTGAEFQPNVQTRAPGQVNNAGMTPEEDLKAGWQVALVLGVVNVGLVFLATHFRYRLLSSAIILFLLIGLYGGYSALKDGIENKSTLSILCGIAGIVMSAFAAVIYVIKIAWAVFD